MQNLNSIAGFFRIIPIACSIIFVLGLMPHYKFIWHKHKRKEWKWNSIKLNLWPIHMLIHEIWNKIRTTSKCISWYGLFNSIEISTKLFLFEWYCFDNKNLCKYVKEKKMRNVLLLIEENKLYSFSAIYLIWNSILTEKKWLNEP